MNNTAKNSPPRMTAEEYFKYSPETTQPTELLDGDEGLIKKVVYGDDWIELHSINPYYPPRRFEGEEVLRIRVVGLVKGVFRSFS